MIPSRAPKNPIASLAKHAPDGIPSGSDGSKAAPGGAAVSAEKSAGSAQNRAAKPQSPSDRHDVRSFEQYLSRSREVLAQPLPILDLRTLFLPSTIQPARQADYAAGLEAQLQKQPDTRAESGQKAPEGLGAGATSPRSVSATRQPVAAPSRAGIIPLGAGGSQAAASLGWLATRGVETSGQSSERVLSAPARESVEGPKRGFKSARRAKCSCGTPSVDAHLSAARRLSADAEAASEDGRMSKAKLLRARSQFQLRLARESRGSGA